jgi:retron-type reverse transcriptase
LEDRRDVKDAVGFEDLADGSAMILKATGKKGVPQGGVISPLLSNLYLNEVDRMLEKAVDVTRRGKSTNVHMHVLRTTWWF